MTKTVCDHETTAGGSALCGAWVDFVRRWAWAVVLASLALTALSGWYVATRLSINTSTTDMLSAELPFRRDSIRLEQSFPQFSGNIVIVIDGATADQADDAAAKLNVALRKEKNRFRSVFDPHDEPFLRRNGLLFLDEDELTELVDRLAGAQAFLGTLWRDPSLRGLFGVLTLALENRHDTAPPVALGRVLAAIADTADSQLAGQSGVLSWRALIEGDALAKDAKRRVIVTQPTLDEASLQPASDAIAAIRTAVRELGLTPENGVRVRLTGSAALEEEELESVATGMGWAGLISAVLVLLFLFWALRSPRLVAAMLVTLVMGLIWTAGFATLAVGQLNLISVAFAVLFVGLSVDFGIHFTLHLREEIDTGEPFSVAFRKTGRSVGKALTLCAVAAAISFYSFLPTDYVGLAELGAIAGSGMFIALFANLTVLPALIAVWLPPVRTGAMEVRRKGVSRRMSGWLSRHARSVTAAALVLGLVAAGLAPSARFDFDPLNLRDPSTESVSTLLDLMSASEVGPYSIDILTDDREHARSLAARLNALPAVASILSVESFIPKQQDVKLEILDSAALMILPSLDGSTLPPPGAAARARAFEKFRDMLRQYKITDVTTGEAIAGRLSRVLARLPASPEALAELERRLLQTLPGRLTALRDALDARRVTLEDLPDPLLRRFVAADGTVRFEVFPEEDVRNPEALRRFVAAVRTIAPNATGSPVIIVEAGRAVIRAFAEAAAISIVAIALLVGVILRRPRDILLVFAPLSLAALLTVAVSVLTGLAFNFANVIVLPLLFGLGVASAIHLVLRERAASGLDGLFGTSTPRAVVFSALTTIGSFASIALSSHPGTASMGVLLAIAITLTLLCTLIVLPALMVIVRGGDKSR